MNLAACRAALGSGDPVPIQNDDNQAMIVTVTIQTDTGRESYTGHVVSSGPRTMKMLLTEPFSQAGRTAQFPLDAVVSQERRDQPSVVAGYNR